MKIEYVEVVVEYTKNGSHAYQKLNDIDQKAVAEVFKDVEINEKDVIDERLIGESRKAFIKVRNKFEEDFLRDFFAKLPRTAIFKGFYGNCAWTRILTSECDRIEVRIKYYYDTDEELEVKL